MRRLFMFAIVSASLFSCEKEGNLNPPTTVSDPDQNETTAGCDTTLAPIVMCHGFLASGDTYALQVKRFIQDNYCGGDLYVFDWNSLGGGSSVDALDEFINGVLERSGSSKVELVGHSAGGGMGYDYLSDASRAAKVAHYVHLASNPQSGPAGPNGIVPTLNIYSPYDAIVQGADIPGAQNLVLAQKDHYQVATSQETYEAMFNFFTATQTASSVIVPDGIRAVGGRALTLGENEPLVGATVNVYVVESNTGYRQSQIPEVSYITNEFGQWGCFNALPDTHYEFELIPAESGERTLHYYREPFATSDQLVYLRAFPPSVSLAGLLLASVPENDQQAVVVSFTSSQAVITGRDEMTVNSVDLSTPTFASVDNTTIAYFLYDDGDNQTELTSAGLFGSFPFLSGVDVFFPTVQQETITLTFNQRALHVPNWRSQTDGVTVVVFD